ncbi:AGAP005746-PA-like protein [Anopheles sinensis]|uniref:AGAP005746-PA-like protein n=1 Tax=Anopheles sinensis TaxID=74873 RepID=A0A084WJK9_ANOSI|nr:AGAP005746-PA-like protein [Anopheles sinensis]
MSAEENVRIKKKNRWTQAMLEHLIKLWGKYYPELKTMTRGHEKVYAKMIEDLAMIGWTASMEDIRGRLHNLAGKYRKEAIAQYMTGRQSQWPYFSKMALFYEYTVPANQPRMYDMLEYLELDYMNEDTLDLEENERVVVQEGELSDEEHLEEVQYEEGRSEIDDWQSEQLEDENMAEEQLAEEPLPEVLPVEVVKEQSEPEVEVEKSPRPERSSDETQHVDNKEQESSVNVEAELLPSSPKGKLYQLKSTYRYETIEDFLRILYSNQLYTDVSIVTCHDGEIFTIPAHRLVLANFSPHFSNIFEKLKPVATVGSMSLVLPPDISHKVMQILLEYMYTGFSHVPEELLDEVLRCGMQLKIRGFWSEKTGEQAIKRPTESTEEGTSKNPPRKVARSRTDSLSSAVHGRPSVSGRRSSRDKDEAVDEADALTEEAKMTPKTKLQSNQAMDKEPIKRVENPDCNGKVEPKLGEFSKQLKRNTSVTSATEERSPPKRNRRASENALVSPYHPPRDGEGSKNIKPIKLKRYNSLTCMLCRERFATADEWIGHIEDVHAKEVGVVDELSTDKHITMLQCDLCQQYLASEQGWLRHVLRKHTDEYPDS